MRKRNNKGIIGTIAISLVAILLVGALGAVTKGFRDWNYKDWLNNSEQETANILAVDSDGNKLEAGKTYPMASRMAFTSAASLMSTPTSSYEGVTLNATISPSNADNKKVDWTVEWVNPSSSWANGKTVAEYVTVSPASDGALTATVNCLQDFGEQIKIVVTSRVNINASAECLVDFAQRIIGISVSGDVYTTDGVDAIKARSFVVDSNSSAFYSQVGDFNLQNFDFTINYSNYMNYSPMSRQFNQVVKNSI